MLGGSGEHPLLPLLICVQSHPESLVHFFLLFTVLHGPHLPPFFLFSQPQPRRTPGGAVIHAAGIGHPTRKRAVHLEAAEARDDGDGGEEEGSFMPLSGAIRADCQPDQPECVPCTSPVGSDPHPVTTPNDAYLLPCGLPHHPT